ncbi:MAG: hypothetical protein WKF96_23220 [Solirubrobacteraceae bacterium]
MNDFADRLEAELRTAADRRNDRFLSRVLRSSRILVLGILAALVISVPATALVTGWQPQLGTSKTPGPSTTADAPPAAQLSQLGVLRRSQTDTDRGAAAINALRYFPQDLDGVRLRFVRVVDVADGAPPIVLAPVARAGGGKDTLAAPSRANVLCAFAAEPNPTGDSGFGDGGGFGCYSDADIASGRAILGLGDRVYALAPDGARKVTVAKGAEPVLVKDNVYSYTGTGLNASREITYEDGRRQHLGATDPKPALPPPTAVNEGSTTDCGDGRLVGVKKVESYQQTCSRDRR